VEYSAVRTAVRVKPSSPPHQVSRIRYRNLPPGQPVALEYEFSMNRGPRPASAISGRENGSAPTFSELRRWPELHGRVDWSPAPREAKRRK